MPDLLEHTRRALLASLRAQGATEVGLPIDPQRTYHIIWRATDGRIAQTFCRADGPLQAAAGHGLCYEFAQPVFAGRTGEALAVGWGEHADRATAIVLPHVAVASKAVSTYLLHHDDTRLLTTATHGGFHLDMSSPFAATMRAVVVERVPHRFGDEHRVVCRADSERTLQRTAALLNAVLTLRAYVPAEVLA